MIAYAKIPEIDMSWRMCRKDKNIILLAFDVMISMEAGISVDQCWSNAVLDQSGS